MAAGSPSQTHCTHWMRRHKSYGVLKIPVISMDFAERQREVFPRAEVSILSDSGLWPFIDDPDAVVSIIVPFLRRQLGAR